MKTNILTNTVPPESISPEPRSLKAALVAALLLAARRYLKRKPAAQPELLGRAEFAAEMRNVSERIHAEHLDLLEKIEANHRELLAALERQSVRISSLEAGFARLDERTTR